MREKILIGVICGLVIILIGIGVYVYVTPTITLNKEVVAEAEFPENKLPEIIKISKPNYRIPRVFAIRNYMDELVTDEVNLLPKVRFYVVDSKATGHLLILPFETGGRIIVSKVAWDEYNEEYVQSDKAEDILIDETITPDYGLLLKYDRPETKPDIQIKIIQGKQTATYIVEPRGTQGNRQEIAAIQYISED